MRTSLVIWTSADTAEQARAFAEQGRRMGHEVVLAGDGKECGEALRAALATVTGDAVVLQEPDAGYTLDSLAQLVGPIERDEADVVVGRRAHTPLQEAALDRVAGFALDLELRDVASGQKAFRASALKDLELKSQGDEVEAELLVKLAAQLYRFSQVVVPGPAEPRPWPTLLALARTFVRYATVTNDADNEHEGYSTLAHLDAAAPNYNAWLGERFRRHAGARVLEIGAGIGTITAHLAAGREKVVALEVDPFYVRRLKNRFRGQKNVEPYQSDVALADWKTLAAQHFDTIVLSNVLEHIEDDAGAVQTFAKILDKGGRVLILVPALPFLFGTLDEAVGHHRRYTPAALREVLAGSGFEVEQLDWMNLVGMPGWFVNGRLLRRRVLPALQLRVYDRVAPLLARAESHVKLPVGLSLFCVARRQ